MMMEMKWNEFNFGISKTGVHDYETIWPFYVVHHSQCERQ